jgi:hypothetical protein
LEHVLVDFSRSYSGEAGVEAEDGFRADSARNSPPIAKLQPVIPVDEVG